MTLTITTPLVGLLPPGRIRRFCGQMTFKITFRTMVRGICGVVRYHDEQYKPKSTGLCVANHTSVIDVAILSSNHCYSMVGCFFFKFSGCFFRHVIFGYHLRGYFLSWDLVSGITFVKCVLFLGIIVLYRVSL